MGKAMPGRKRSSHWASWGVRIYYALGFSYYFYQWFLVGGGVGLAITAASYVYGSGVFLVVTAAAVSVILIIIGLVIFILNVRKRYKGANPGLKLLSSRTTYRILPNHEFEYTRELEVAAAFDGVDHFTHSFGWSGEGEIRALAPNGYRAELIDDDRSTDKKLRVYFDRPHRKREKFKFHFTLAMTDTGNKARNFFRVTIHEKVRHLDCEVEFSADACPAKYKQAIYMSLASEIPVYEEELAIQREEHKILWPIPKPRFDYNYCITW
jgi:hypothetical protein